MGRLPSNSRRGLFSENDFDSESDPPSGKEPIDEYFRRLGMGELAHDAERALGGPHDDAFADRRQKSLNALSLLIEIRSTHHDRAVRKLGTNSVISAKMFMPLFAAIAASA